LGEHRSDVALKPDAKQQRDDTDPAEELEHQQDRRSHQARYTVDQAKHHADKHVTHQGRNANADASRTYQDRRDNGRSQQHDEDRDVIGHEWVSGRYGDGCEQGVATFFVFLACLHRVAS
jgi:hypothetical protein